MRKTLGVLLISAICGVAHASNWVVVNVSDEGLAASVDVSSIKSAGAIKGAWTQIKMPRHSTPGTGVNSNKWLASIKYHDSYNCADAKSRDDAVTYYYEDGSSSVMEARTFWQGWSPIVPNTLGESQFKKVCGESMKYAAR